MLHASNSNFEWEPLEENISAIHDRDSLIDIILKRFIIDSMTNAIEDEEENNLEKGLLNSCIGLDFVYNEDLIDLIQLAGEIPFSSYFPPSLIC